MSDASDLQQTVFAVEVWYAAPKPAASTLLHVADSGSTNRQIAAYTVLSACGTPGSSSPVWSDPPLLRSTLVSGLYTDAAYGDRGDLDEQDVRQLDTFPPQQIPLHRVSCLSLHLQYAWDDE